jgi:adenosine deaminase
VIGLPKVVLHDHLDGGLRPATILELAADIGYEGLPHADRASLASWFDQSRSGSLERYLAAFEQTVAVMQTEPALRRVATEAVEDLAADGVVYSEIRFAPSLHTRAGLSRREVLRAVLAGVVEGEQRTGTVGRVIVDAMRQDDDSAAVARAAAEFVGEGVVGFDLAGPEAGFPPTLHREAIDLARRSGLRITIHAGEADGPASIAVALDCFAERLGHGVRIADDLVLEAGRVAGLGPVAARVHRERIPLEVCPLSNVHTGAARSLAEHPIGLLHRAGFVVTINTDNRLMSGTSMSKEFAAVSEHHGFGPAALRRATLHAVDAAFCDEETRRLIGDRVSGGYPEE